MKKLWLLIISILISTASVSAPFHGLESSIVHYLLVYDHFALFHPEIKNSCIYKLECIQEKSVDFYYYSKDLDTLGPIGFSINHKTKTFYLTVYGGKHPNNDDLVIKYDFVADRNGDEHQHIFHDDSDPYAFHRHYKIKLNESSSSIENNAVKILLEHLFESYDIPKNRKESSINHIKYALLLFLHHENVSSLTFSDGSRAENSSVPKDSLNLNMGYYW